MIHKNCTTCGECKPLTKYERLTRGWRNVCKPCRVIAIRATQTMGRERRRLGIVAQPEQPDRSYTPPTPEQFLPMPPPLVRVALVWASCELAVAA